MAKITCFPKWPLRPLPSHSSLACCHDPGHCFPPSLLAYIICYHSPPIRPLLQPTYSHLFPSYFLPNLPVELVDDPDGPAPGVVSVVRPSGVAVSFSTTRWAIASVIAGVNSKTVAPRSPRSKSSSDTSLDFTVLSSVPLTIPTIDASVTCVDQDRFDSDLGRRRSVSHEIEMSEIHLLRMCKIN